MDPNAAHFICVYSSRGGGAEGIGSSEHYTLTEEIIIWASIHLKIVSVNKSEDCGVLKAGGERGGGRNDDNHPH